MEFSGSVTFTGTWQVVGNENKFRIVFTSMAGNSIYSRELYESNGWYLLLEDLCKKEDRQGFIDFAEKLLQQFP